MWVTATWAHRCPAGAGREMTCSEMTRVGFEPTPHGGLSSAALPVCVTASSTAFPMGCEPTVSQSTGGGVLPATERKQESRRRRAGGLSTARRLRRQESNLRRRRSERRVPTSRNDSAERRSPRRPGIRLPTTESVACRPHLREGYRKSAKGGPSRLRGRESNPRPGDQQSPACTSTGPRKRNSQRGRI